MNRRIGEERDLGRVKRIKFLNKETRERRLSESCVCECVGHIWSFPSYHFHVNVGWVLLLQPLFFSMWILSEGKNLNRWRSGFVYSLPNRKEN